MPEELEAACAEGGTTLFNSGIEPGWINDLVLFAFSSTCARIDRITMQEILDYAPIAQPDVMYDESDNAGAPGCYQPPVFVKGRSYMYGLSDGEMPNLSPCR